MHLPAPPPVRPRTALVTLAAVAGCAFLLSSSRGGGTGTEAETAAPPPLAPRGGGGGGGLLRRALSPLTKQHRTLKLMPQQEVLRYAHPIDEAAADDAPPKWGQWYMDIDYGQPGLCGGRKCFFISVSNPAYGYLIENAVFKDSDRLEEARQAHVYAERLAETFGVRTFDAAPPFAWGVPPYFRDHLQGEYVDFYGGAKKVIVQPSRTAPENSVVVRCYDERLMIGRLARILGGMDPADRTNLARELTENVAIVRANMELVKDYQLLVDPKGRTYHLDFDRTIIKAGREVQSTEKIERCLEGAAAYVEGYRTEAEARAYAERHGRKEVRRARREHLARVAARFGRRRRHT